MFCFVTFVPETLLRPFVKLIDPST